MRSSHSNSRVRQWDECAGRYAQTYDNNGRLHLAACTPLNTFDQRRAARTTHLLIRAVRAVQVAVAAPSRGDADIFRALELRVRDAGDAGAVSLVGAVPAVVVAVAHPALLNALPVRASELVRSTRVIWPCTREHIQSCYVYCTPLAH